jgi:hypothetical protein
MFETLAGLLKPNVALRRYNLIGLKAVESGTVLDNALQDFIDQAPDEFRNATYAAMRERSVGLGVMGFHSFLQDNGIPIESVMSKYDYMQRWGVATPADIAKTLAVFGAFTEGLQLFASFAILLNFPRFNKMKGMGQIVTWSVRDEIHNPLTTPSSLNSRTISEKRARRSILTA